MESPFIWLITGCWIFFLLFWIISSFRVKKNNKEADRNSTIRLFLFVFISFFFSPQNLQEIIGIHMLSSSLFVQGVGVLACIVGVAFAIWARIYLSTNWGMPMSQKEDLELVTTGPYHFVRHPIYTGICLAMLGSAITGGMAWFICSCALVFGLFTVQKKKKSICSSGSLANTLIT